MAPTGYTDHGTIRVCTCCMLTHANAECGDDCHDAEPWSVLPMSAGWEAAMGTDEHDAECTEGDREEGCGCESMEFSWSACDGCGTSLGGSRFAFVLWRRIASSASL